MSLFDRTYVGSVERGEWNVSLDNPEDVRQTLADSASRRGQSLQSYLLKLVTDEASRTANATMLSHFANRTDGSSLSDADLTLVIEQARSERGPDATTRHT